MPGSKSDYLENAQLNHALGGPDFVRPATVYLALFSVNPSDAGGGTELSGGGYARTAIANNGTNWPPASGGIKSNGTAFTTPTATADWSVIAVALMDSATPGTGNFLYWFTYDTSGRTPVVVPTGQNASFPAGTIVITED